jgi:5'-3' exonuclease
MGINGLESYLKGKYAGRVRRPVSWIPSSIPAGTRWAVDVAYLLYRAESAGFSALTVVASLIVRIRRTGAEPVFIFDGRSSPAKAAVVEQRRVARTAARERTAVLEEELATTSDLTEAERGDREVEIAELRAAAPTVRRSAVSEVKRFLYSAGVLGVTAAGEADDLLAWLARNGVVSAVISRDFDMLARGVSVMLVPETPDATVWSQFELSAVLGALRLTYDQFAVACTLMGSDYMPRPAGMSVGLAIEQARSLGDVALEDVSGASAAIALLRGDDMVWGSLLDERQQEKCAAGAPARESEAMDAHFVEKRWPGDWRPFL